MYFEHNMEIMRRYRVELYNKIMNNISSENRDEICVKTVSTRVNETALVVEERNGQVIRLNSIYNPIIEAQKWAEQYSVKNLQTVIIMFGFGNGIFAREIIKKMDKDNRLIVFEPSYTIFNYVLHEYNIDDILKDERIGLVIQGINENELPSVVSNTLSWENLFSKIECTHPGYDKLFPDYYNQLKELIINNTFISLIAKNTNQALGKLSVDNALTNIPYLKEANTIWDLDALFPKDIPVIIVAAGPSLNKNIDILKQAKGKSIILAVDRAYETLLEHNIEPDFVVLLDPVKTLKMCGNKPNFTTPLLCKLEGSPEIMENHIGKKIIFDCKTYIEKLYQLLDKRFYHITSGGSVATAAFAICANLRFKRIIFVGLDLAFQGELSHSGSIQDDKKRLKKHFDIYVDGIDGNKVKTRNDWYSFKVWFEYVFTQLPDIDIIDATEGGARINGTRIMTLQEVVLNYCNKEINCSDLINNLEPTFNLEDRKKIYDYLLTGKDELSEARKLAETALKNCKKLENTSRKSNNSTDMNKTYKKISNINKKIQKMSIYSLIDNYIISEDTNRIQALYFLTKDKDKDNENTFDNVTKIYKTMISACDYLEPKFSEVIEIFNS